MSRKILESLATFIVASILVFFVVVAMPGDPVENLARTYMTSENLPYDIAYERAKVALNYDPDVPIMVRFLSFLKGVATGKLGQSMVYKSDVIDIVLGALPWTLLVSTISLFLAFLVGNLIGLFLAWRRNKVLDAIMLAYQSIFGSIPPYIIAYVIVLIFSVRLRIFPSRGAYSSNQLPGWNIGFITSVAYHATLPILTYFLTTVSGWILGMKAICMSVLGEDYINYAKARGLSQSKIIVSYLGKNAILPQITTLAIVFAGLFGGSPLIENLFVYPGVGYYLGAAIGARDYPVMQGMFLIIIFTVLVSGILADFINSQINPLAKARK